VGRGDVGGPGSALIFRDLPDGLAAGATTRQLAPDGLGAGETARRLAEALGAASAEISRVVQVHGCEVVEVSGPAVRGGDRVRGEADALITEMPDRLLAVSTADCVPILLADPETGWLAAVHAGWRGTALRIVDAVLDRLENRGVSPRNLLALFGPSISGSAYEVGPEVTGALRKALPAEAMAGGGIQPGRGDRSHVDLGLVNEALLLLRGVSAGRVRREPLCTATDADRFPSFRREGPRAGRIVTGIVRIERPLGA